jgi:hypothetical protein
MPPRKPKPAPKTKAKLKKNEKGVILLSGGNPQIEKGEGDAPVQAYIAAMPGWKSDLGKRLDMLITKGPSQGAEGGEVELAVLRRRRAGLVPEPPRLHALCEGGFLPGGFAETDAARRQQGQEHAHPRHP